MKIDKKTIGNTLRVTGLVSLLTAAGAFGAAAYDPSLLETEVEILGETLPLLEVAGHAAGLGGIAQTEIGRRLAPLPKNPGDGPG